MDLERNDAETTKMSPNTLGSQSTYHAGADTYAPTYLQDHIEHTAPAAQSALSPEAETTEIHALSQDISENEAGVRFRCPHCQKLYRTNQDAFEGVKPEFDCVSCGKAFTLTHEINSFGLYVTNDLGQKGFTNCPKCSHLKPGNVDECPSCGVFASKFEELQKVESPSLFELNQIWQKAVLDFTNDQLHQDFLNCCQKKMALNFAFKKYSDLQKTMGFDSACEKYMNQIELRLEQQFRTPATNDKTVVKKDVQFFHWIFISVGCLGMALLIFNKIRPTFPNLTGLVVAITVLSFGLGLVSSQRNRDSGIKL